MNYSFEPVRAKAFESSFSGDVGDDNCVEVGRGDTFECCLDCLRLLLRPNSGDDGVASLQKDIDDMAGNEACTAYSFSKKDLVSL